jgi:hypothetical protein
MFDSPLVLPRGGGGNEWCDRPFFVDPAGSWSDGRPLTKTEYFPFGLILMVSSFSSDLSNPVASLRV